MIEVILRQDVPALGKTGQVVRVKPGYARNFLFPRGLAVEATEGGRRAIENEAKARAKHAAEERAAAAALRDRLAALAVSVTGKAGEGGRLFGAVTAADIAQAVAALGVTLDKRRIDLGEPIKTLGYHTVSVRLHPEVVAELRVRVVEG